jgi:general secretion pathway protein G
MFRHFTIGALLIVTAIFATSCGAERSEYDKTIARSRETVLRDNLDHLRKSIDLFTADRGFLPQSLDDLVKAGYVREIPTDPITEGKDWKVTIEDDPNNKGKQGITDVHSASTTKSSEGTLYSDW